MNLNDLIVQMNDPEEDLRREAIQKRVDQLRTRVAADSQSVADAELVQGIQDLFNLEETSGCLDHADWLMNTLTFTRTPISSKQMASAWAAFQTGS